MKGNVKDDEKSEENGEKWWKIEVKGVNLLDIMVLVCLEERENIS